MLYIFLYDASLFPGLAQSFQVPSFAMDAVAPAFWLVISWVGMLTFTVVIAFWYIIADSLSASFILELVDLFKNTQHQQTILNSLIFTS